MTERRADIGDLSSPLDTIARTRELLRQSHNTDATGGSTPHLVLRELVCDLALDLSSHFSDMPCTRFIGIVRRGRGPMGWMLPRFVPHKVIVGRYLHYTPPVAVSEEYTHSVAQIAVVALGEDGSLRRGVFAGDVMFPAGTEPVDAPIAHDDLFLERVPPSRLRLHDWTGGVDPVEGASPARVLEALNMIVKLIADGAAHDHTLVQALLEPRKAQDDSRIGPG